jgi:hypothetical protein
MPRFAVGEERCAGFAVKFFVAEERNEAKWHPFNFLFDLSERNAPSISLFFASIRSFRLAKVIFASKRNEN